jgi:hypothetical protein
MGGNGWPAAKIIRPVAARITATGIARSRMNQLRDFFVMLCRQLGKKAAGVNHSGIDEVQGIDLTNDRQRTIN